MRRATFGSLAILLLTLTPISAAEPASAELARKAHDILATHCYRCHGQNGNVEGGMNYLLDRAKLIARRKVIPGNSEQSPLYKRIAAGKMPPPGETPRPSPADVAVLKQWIDAGAPDATSPTPQRPLATDAVVFARILADLETLDRRSRRFVRYFTLTNLANAGLGDDELQTYRNALAKLVNSLSWMPRITLPRPIDPERTILRIDLREYQWDANLWNRLLADYPYGVLCDTAAARAASVATGTRMPFVRADWFVATASRMPLYGDLLQLPATLPELERQLRVDAAVDIQQERVARAGFNGSGIARNNRLLERHDAVHGAYWRTYDFDAVPQNLIDRDNLLPDRRNLFAHPLGPGFTEASFQHAGGEAIFNLPNGLQGYFIVNAVGQRLDKASTNLVSDPKRPDKAVETGVSCIGCHYAGINFKDDQVRHFVHKNRRAFTKSDVELIESLYPPHERMRALMEEDAERFHRAVEKCGVKVSAAEPVLAMTLRYEDDVDLPAAAGEVGLRPEAFRTRLTASGLLGRNLGALEVAGGTVQRQVWVQGFGDVVREMHLGAILRPTLSGQTLPDNTGELDPLEGRSGQANAVAFSPDGRFTLLASADKSVRLWDVEAGRDLRRFIGHTASVWCVAFSPDGKRALSGGADASVRLWDVETGRELQRLTGHSALVTAVAFAPDGRRALSAGYDQTAIYWDLDTGQALRTFDGLGRYLNAVAFAPDSRRALVAAGRSIALLDLQSGKELARLEGHADAVVCAVYSPDGKRIASAGDDGSVRLWDVPSRRLLKTCSGHVGPVKSVVFSADGHRLLTGGSDGTVRLWDAESGKERQRFTGHTDSVVGVVLVGESQALSAGRDSVIKVWSVARE